MSKRFLTRAAIGILLLGTPLSAGLAQMAWVPGSEISGHAVQVTTNGTVNTVYFDRGGVARIQSPGGNIVPATWSAANRQLCLQTCGDQRCWNY